MKSRSWGLLVASVVLAGSLAMAMGDDANSTPAPTTQPAADMDTPKPKIKLFKPYSLLTDLTDDQREKIAAIHKAYNEALAALKAKQTSDIEALLTDEQKTELTAAESDSEQQAKSAKTEANLSNKVNADQEKLDKAKAASGDNGNDN